MHGPAGYDTDAKALTHERFVELVERVQRAAAMPSMRAYSERVAPTYDDDVELACQVADAVAATSGSLSDPANQAVLAAAIASRGVPVVMEGRCLSAPHLVDDVDVLVQSRLGKWVPVGQPRCTREPVYVVRLRL